MTVRELLNQLTAMCFIIPADGGSARQLTEGNFNHYGSLAWSPDSEHIFFSAYRSEDWELVSDEADIYSVALSTKEIKQITTQTWCRALPSYITKWKIDCFLAEKKDDH